MKIVTFNCKNIKTCGKTFDDLLVYGDIFLVQEHWLFDFELKQLSDVHQNLSGTGKAVDTGNSIPPTHKKVQVGKDQEKAQSEKDSHSKNRGGKKPN